MNKIALLGYMGSGKSAIGKLLVKKINFDLIDLDEIIEKEQGMTIKNIFDQKGELFFRKLENQVLKKILRSNKNCVISLGGGTPCYANNLELLKNEETLSIYLKSSIDLLFQRLNERKSKRPLIANMEENELKEYIAKHLFERSFYYNQAGYTIDTDNKSLDDVAEEIKKLLF